MVCHIRSLPGCSGAGGRQTAARHPLPDVVL
jgi:hypothetical protein